MGERTFVDTTDIRALTQRIQELEKENARLKAILDKNGIEKVQVCGLSQQTIRSFDIQRHFQSSCRKGRMGA